MNLVRRVPVLLVATSAISLPSASLAVTGVRVIIENRAPAGGTYLTPFWVGFHGGGFDTHDMLAPASVTLERLAEDGDTGPMVDLFAADPAGEVQGVMVSDTGNPALAPGETATMTFVLDELDFRNWFFSYASMVIPSNDAFIANDDPKAHRIFDTGGNFLGGFITIHGTDVKDAGTEVNDEIPEHTAFFGQTEPDSGVDQFSVVHTHPGYLPPGSGGILDDPQFASADFTAPGYEVARIIIVRNDTVVTSGAVSGNWNLDGSPYLVDGDIIVLPGDTLDIDPGVQVVFRNVWRLFVEGTLNAVGTVDNPVRFTKDPAISGWGGIRFFHAVGAGVLTHCVIDGADISLMGAPFDRGGGIHCENSAVAIDHCTVRDNRAVNGGGIYSDGCNLVVSYSDIVENTAVAGIGGGIYCDGFDVPLLFENNITDNFARIGGGIACNQADALIINNFISENEAYDNDIFRAAHAYGAGIYLSDGADATISGNIIADNLAHAQGNVGTSAKGAAIRCRQADPLIMHNTISGNVASVVGPMEAEGGAISCYNAYPTVVNSILWNDLPQEIALSRFGFHSAVTLNYCDVDGGEEGIETNGNGTVHWQDGNIVANPMFADPLAGDYGLQAESPCIDAGDSGSIRDPDGTIADMGALYFSQGDEPPGDLDDDGDVDLDDYDLFADCLAGPGENGTAGGCATDLFEQADMDGDSDVDLIDFSELQRLFGRSSAGAGACCIRGFCIEAPDEYTCTRYDGVYHGERTSCAEIDCDFWEYKNETDLTIFSYEPGAGRKVADDMTLSGNGTRELIYYDLLVYAFQGGPFDVSAELWTDCPGSGGTLISGTSKTWVGVPDDNQVTLLTADLNRIAIPETVWMVVEFSSDFAGWFTAGEAEDGSTSNIFAQQEPLWNCAADFAGERYAGFWANIRCE